MDNLSFERKLVSKLKTGDKNAYSFLFTAYYSDLVLFAATFLKDMDASEEIVQDVFLKLWEDREVIIVTTNLKSFLLKLIQNRCLDVFRHLKVINAHQESVIHSMVLLECDTENYILRSEIENIVEQTLDKLPVEISEAFRLSRYECLKYKEIAEKMQVSVRTVEVRICKVLQILRDELKDYLVTLSFLFATLFW